jgi:hypothetical protein
MFILSRSIRTWIILDHAHQKFANVCRTKGATMADVSRKANAIRRLERYRAHFG